MVMRRRERRRTRAGRLPRERPRRGGHDVPGEGDADVFGGKSVGSSARFGVVEELVGSCFGERKPGSGWKGG